MKIVFLCGSLEQGRDGVGDYTRKLAEELALTGHQVAVIALADWYLDKVLEVKKPNLLELRVPFKLRLSKRFALVKKWVGAFDPDWFSIQFVPYTYHFKGLPFYFLIFLKSLVSKKRVHLMFHETWVGLESRSEWKLKILTVLQKILIKRMVYSICPRVIHTHLPFYQKALEKFGFNVRFLPLFSNITMVNSKKADSESEVLRIGFFSQVEYSESIDLFLRSLLEKAAREKIRYEVLIIGGESNKIKSFCEATKKVELLRGKMKFVGLLSPDDVSKALQSCHLGITPVPRHGLGKSGSVAAFLAHGVPVAAPNIHFKHDVAEIGFFYEGLRLSILTNPDLADLKVACAYANAARNQLHVSFVAKTFVSDLKERLYE
jgi:hypothetical protein